MNVVVASLIALVISPVAYYGMKTPSESITKTGGSQFFAMNAKINVQKRENLAVELMESGTMPSSSLTYREIRAGNKDFDIRFYVTADYMSLGNDQDSVVMPLNFHNAVRLAKALNAVLPTTKMVDLIYQQADLKVQPTTMYPGPQMTSDAYILEHQRHINQQFKDSPAGAIKAGHKKDTVLSNKLLEKPNRIAIYGWHQLSSKPIQPLCTWHIASYADYSHGVRLVKREIQVNGEILDIAEALKNKQLANFLSKEGIMDIDALMAPNEQRLERHMASIH